QDPLEQRRRGPPPPQASSGNVYSRDQLALLAAPVLPEDPLSRPAPRGPARRTNEGRFRYRPAAPPPELTDQAIMCPCSGRLSQRHPRPYASVLAIHGNPQSLGAVLSLAQSRPMRRPPTH